MPQCYRAFVSCVLVGSMSLMVCTIADTSTLETRRSEILQDLVLLESLAPVSVVRHEQIAFSLEASRSRLSKQITSRIPEAPTASMQTELKPQQATVTRILRELQAVKEVKVGLDLGLSAPLRFAARDEDVVEEGEAKDTTSETLPPKPREKKTATPAKATTEANNAFFKEMGNVLKGGGETTPLKSVAAKNYAVVEAKDKKKSPVSKKTAQEKTAAPLYTGDPLYQPVDLVFKDSELSHIVKMLAFKANINVIAGTNLANKPVTVELKNVPLMQAMRTVLRIERLGIVEEEGIYYIVPYEKAIAAERATRMITLKNAKAEEIKRVMDELLTGGPGDSEYVNVSFNKTANVVIFTGPEARIDDMAEIVSRLDVAPIVLPTVTVAIPLNYASPGEIAGLIEKMLTPEIGMVAADSRASHVIVTDEPAVVEQVRSLIKAVDIPVKQIGIDAMVVDVSLGDSAETGVQFLSDSVRNYSRAQQSVINAGGVGNARGHLEALTLDTSLDAGDLAGKIGFHILSSTFDWRGALQAEIRNENSHLISNPTLVTLENITAKLSIAQEIPYVELTQSTAGGQQTSTQFKDIGTTLEVTPRATHDDHIIVHVVAKESDTRGVLNGIPIEAKRSVDTTALLASGETILLGGLRKNNDDTTVRKVPILGDLPVLNVLFRQNSRSEGVNELLVFLTCNVIKGDQELTPYQRETFEDAENEPMAVDAQKSLFKDMVRPGKMRDPIWKWRRTN